MTQARALRSLDFWIVLGVALLVRLAYFFLNSRTNPAFDFLIMDSMHIDAWAKAIAAGHAGDAVYFRGPLVPYLLALVYKAGGGVAGAVFVNHLAGAFTCALVWLLAREYFARAVALTAGLGAALYWPAIYFEGEVLIEPVYVALVVLSLWRLARAIARPTTARLLVAGVCVGLAALARPTILALLPAIPFAFSARTAAPSTPPKRAWLRPSLLVAAACALVLLPTAIRNYTVGKALVPVTWSGGLNFYIGNNPDSDGRSAMIPGAATPWMGGDDEALAIARAQAGDSTLTAAAASRFYARRGVGYLATQPRDAASLVAKKFYMFWEGPERSNEKYIYFFWDRFGLGRVPMPGFWLVSPLALAGMIRLWPRRRELALLYLFVVAYTIGVVAFFVVARYRLPVAPVLIVFAAWTAVELTSMVRARRWRAAMSPLALVAALFVAVNASYPEFIERRPSHIAISHYTLAGAYSDRGDEEGALVELWHARAAYERAPSRYYGEIGQDIYFKLGTLLYQRGKCAEAIKALGEIQPHNPRAHEARFMFAECCEKTGRFPEAGKAYEIVLKTDPANERALRGYIRCLEAVGRWDDAADARKRLPAE
ncbi:MAG TPA: tetratricopeptide repeat protein [Candidatus Krumholzibacteria bacterium]|nr:tetratricopeptide repeat protein [Candidatus Krumholzibacteria bacterium]